MRQYGAVKATFWTSSKTRQYGDDGKLLSLYLLTCTHANALGCFHLPDGYIMEDLGWSRERVKAAFSEIEARRKDVDANGIETVSEPFANRCLRTNFVLICGYLRHNPPANPNVEVSLLRAADAIPDDFSYWPDALDILRPYKDVEVKGRRGCPERLANRFHTVLPNTNTNTPTRTNIDLGQSSEPKPKANGQVSAKGEPAKQPNKRGTRLPADWEPTKEGIAHGQKLGLTDAQIAAQVEAFRDYWPQQPGQKGVKLDWDATFRSWLRNAIERFGVVPGADVGPVGSRQHHWASLTRGAGRPPPADSVEAQTNRRIAEHIGKDGWDTIHAAADPRQYGHVEAVTACRDAAMALGLVWPVPAEN